MSIASEIQRLQTSKASIKASIRNKGVAVPDSANIDTYSTYIDQIQAGGGSDSSVPDVWEGVNFLDYDGTTIAAYGTDYILQTLNTLPTPPTHAGLTFNGWTWTVQEIKNYFTAYPKAQLFVGPKYYPSDGFTHIFIRLSEGNLSPYLNFQYRATSSSAQIDWGDGSTTALSTASSATLVSRKHTYVAPGNYEIKIKNIAGFYGYGGTSGTSLLSASRWGTSVATFRTADRVYQSCVKGVWLQNGSEAYNQSYMLQQARNCEFFISNGLTQASAALFYNDCGIRRVVINKLASASIIYNSPQIKTITIPRGDSSVGSSHFRGSAIQAVALPETITTLGTYVFQNCLSLQKVIIPSGITSIPIYTFGGCSSLSYLDLPSSITSLAANSVANCVGLGYIIFRSSSAPTAADSTVFSNLPTSCEIIVPKDQYVSYISASNYPAFSNYTYSIFATYASGVVLPPSDETFSSITWYATVDDLKSETNPITIGNGKEVYAKVVYGSAPASGLTLGVFSASSDGVVINITGYGSASQVYYKYDTTMPNVGDSVDNSWRSSTIVATAFSASAAVASGRTLYVVTLDDNNKVIKGGSVVVNWTS